MVTKTLCDKVSKGMLFPYSLSRYFLCHSISLRGALCLWSSISEVVQAILEQGHEALELQMKTHQHLWHRVKWAHETFQVEI